MKNGDGRAGVQRLILTLSRVAAECDKRTAAAPDAELGDMGMTARKLADGLAAADQRKQWARAEVRRADEMLVALYREARDAGRRIKARLFARYGWQEDELAAFGVRPPAGKRPGGARQHTREVTHG